MKSNLLTTLFATLFCLFQQVSAQCDLPSSEVVNTGSNMTVMLLPDFISSLPITHFSSYLVAHSPDGLLIGSQVVAGVSQTQIAIWGDDASTVEVDGAGSGEAISFQLVVDNELYDIEMPTSVSFTANGISAQAVAATYTLNCTSEGGTTLSGCTDANACNYNSEATEDDNSCIDPVGCETCSGETDGTGVVVDNDADDDGVCNANEVSGCTDATACNYNSEATEDDGSCITPVGCQTCSGETDGTGVVVDNNSDDPCVETSNVATQGSFSEGYTVNFETDGSSVTVTFELLDSKTDVNAYLWREAPSFTETSMGSVSSKKFSKTLTNQTLGSTISYACKFAYAGGMAVTKYFSYEVGSEFCTSTCEDAAILGCTNTTACNYNSEATEDDNSCINPVACETCSGETDGTGVVVDNDVDDDGVCDADEVTGCTDNTASNYNAEATDDDASCAYTTGACDLPIHYTGNTGSNMTVMLTPDFISSLPITHFSSYLVAHSPDGLLIGSEVVAGVSQTQIAVWGDDSFTDDIDGALTGETISFQLVVDDELYDVEMPTSVSYITNNISVQTSSATSTLVDCSTDVETILGCTDANACNYNSEATEDDNSCINLVACETCSGETDGTGVVVDNDTDDDGVCDVDEVSGCTDATACNYNSEVTEDDSTCAYAEENYDCDGECVSDVDEDGVCDALEVSGCTDATACNYNSEVTEDDSTCAYAEENYDCDGECVSDVDEDGVCDALEVSGCTDNTASNYNAEATEDDGACEYTAVTCDLPDPFTGNTGVNMTFMLLESFVQSLPVSDTGAYLVALSESGMVIGSKNVDGVNQTSLTIWGDDTFTNEIDGALTGETISFQLVDGLDLYDVIPSFAMGSSEFEVNGIASVVASVTTLEDCTSGGQTTVSGCTDVNACNYDANATENDSSCTYAQENYDCAGVCITDTDDDGVCDALEVMGCTDVSATNYDALATENDDSCEYAPISGCTAETACNYNSEATEDDSTCTYAEENYDCDGECISDVDEDGICDALEVSGCTDNTALNYNSEVLEDDGSCVHTVTNCILPPHYTGNTGSNMTVMLTSNVISSLPITHYSSYLVAHTEDGLLVGSEVLAGVNQAAIAIWGDDVSTPEIDGALDGQAISFQLVVDNTLYDVEMPTAVSFTSNSISAQLSSAIPTLNCVFVPVLGCTDPLASNYNIFANVDDETCEYSICVWFDVNNFAVEYSTVLDEVVLSYDVTNLSNQVVFAPEFNIELDSSIFVLGDSVYDSTQMNPNDVVTIHEVITNDLASLSSLVLLSGQVSLTGTTEDAEGEAVDCLFDLNEVFVNTTHVGCTSPNAYNYAEEATIDNSSCIDNLSTSVVSYDPLCTDEYGSALIYVTGGIYPYFSPTTYTTYSTTGVLTADIPIEFNEEGIAYLSGLDGGEYVIEVHDNSIVVTLDTFNIVMPLGIEVEAAVQSNGLLYSTLVLGEPVLYQWLFNGISIEGATNTIHYPQELGTYQVYVENAQGCGDYSAIIDVTFIGIEEFSGKSFSMYPNPAHSSITLSLDQLSEKTMVSFTDILGQELRKITLDSRASTVDYTFDISELPNGLYFINVSNNSNQIVKRFVKN